MPSAFVREVMEPAPRGSGAATTRSPTLPSFTRKNSSRPTFDGIFLAVTALIAGLLWCGSPCITSRYRDSERLEGENSRNRVPWVADNRLSVHYAENCWLTRHHGHAVNQNFTEFLYRCRGVVFAPRGRPCIYHYEVRIRSDALNDSRFHHFILVTHDGSANPDPASLFDKPLEHDCIVF